MPDWFREVFGFSESRSGSSRSYDLTKAQFEYDARSGTLKTKPAPPGEMDMRGGDLEPRTFAAGTFETPSLQELRERVDLAEASGKLGGQRLTIEEVVGDVSQLHVPEKNRYATFQAASQFNTLEHPSQRGTPEQGITCYEGDRTQGPACATACAPGTIVRNYFGLDMLGQSKDRQVRNLADVEELLDNGSNDYFEVMNGYTLSNGAKLNKLTKVLRADEPLCEAVRARLRIGVQADTEVVCSKFGAERYKGPPGQLVTQAYCSAISVSYSRCSEASWEAFAKLILDSLYEATLYVAVENALRNPTRPGARKVFLTAVGGGVFGNDMGWIEEAMLKAARKFEGVGLEVFLVSFGRSDKTMKFVETTWASASAEGWKELWLESRAEAAADSKSKEEEAAGGGPESSAAASAAVAAPAEATDSKVAL